MMTSTKISTVIGLAAAVLIVLQAHQLSVQKHAFDALQEKVAESAPQAQPSQAWQAEMAKLREQNAAYAKTIEAMQRDVAKARAHATDALAAKSAATAAAVRAKANPFGEMFKDPAMLESMRPQQIATAKMMYGPLIKQLNLSPEQADKFYNLLVDNGIRSMTALQSGNAEEIKAADQAIEANVRSFLGDAGYAQFENYAKNDVTDQAIWTGLKNDFTENPLSDTQQQQLLQAMKAARQSVTASNPLDLSQINFSDKAAAMSQAMQQSLQQQEQINQNVLQQAAAFLSPQQLQTLSTSQSNMVASQKAMAPMMQQMLSGPSTSP